MRRKMAFILLVLFCCLGLTSCQSPEEPEPVLVLNYEYRDNVEVVYTHAGGQTNPNEQLLFCDLYDPALLLQPNPREYDICKIQMDKIGENKYRCTIPKVFIQTQAHSKPHYLLIWFDKNEPIIMSAIDKIEIQGAYDQEARVFDETNYYKFRLWFKMSKD
jgi:hypothetical protein